ncbi:hypothetical protein Tco_1305365 [Tanacetum coccineum]
MSTSSVLKVGIPISVGMTAFVPYVSDNGVSPLLDLIMVRCAHKTCGISSIQSLLLSSSRAFISSSKLLFALSTKPLACGCLMEAKRWRMYNFSHQSLNGLSLNCFPLSDIVSPGRPNLQTILSHTNFLIRLPVIVATVIMEYLVKISKKARILELKRRYLKIIILITNTPKDQYAVFKPYGNKIFWKISNVVRTPRNPQYAVSKTFDTP